MAKNHPWMLTTLGCPRTPDPTNSPVEKFLSWGLPRSRASLAEPTGMVNLSSGIPQELIGSGIPRVRSSRASKGGEHPRVVLGQPRKFKGNASKIQGAPFGQVPLELPGERREKGWESSGRRLMWKPRIQTKYNNHKSDWPKRKSPWRPS